MDVKQLLGVVVFLSRITNVWNQETVLTGDVYIEGIFSLYENSAGHCGQILPASVQHMEAVRWTLQELKNARQVDDLHIGKTPIH